MYIHIQSIRLVTLPISAAHNWWDDSNDEHSPNGETVAGVRVKTRNPIGVTKN